MLRTAFSNPESPAVFGTTHATSVSARHGPCGELAGMQVLSSVATV